MQITTLKRLSLVAVLLYALLCFYMETALRNNPPLAALVFVVGWLIIHLVTSLLYPKTWIKCDTCHARAPHVRTESRGLTIDYNVLIFACLQCGESLEVNE